MFEPDCGTYVVRVWTACAVSAAALFHLAAIAVLLAMRTH